MLKISSFSRMKSFSDSGRLGVILRLSLPFVKQTEECAEDSVNKFNSFYSSMADAYQRGAAALVPSCLAEGTPPIKVSVSFEEQTALYLENFKKASEKAKKVTAIKRILKVNICGSIKSFEDVDLFDTEAGLFIKTPKKYNKTKK